MTVSSTISRNVYVATAGQTNFTIPFQYQQTSDVKVYQNSVLLTETTDYTIVATTLTLVTGATEDDVISIERDATFQRTTDIATNGDFTAAAVNAEFDNIWLALQELSDDPKLLVSVEDTGSITIPSPTERAGLIFSFDSNGDPSITQEIGTYTGDWTTGTAYALRDIVKDTATNNIYICTTAHTAGATFAGDAANWQLIVDAASATASAAAAAASEAAAAISEANAATSETNAATSESNASTSETNAAASEAAVTALYDSFDDSYLGPKAADPTLDNDGDPLQAGQLYFNTGDGTMRVYTGSVWQVTYNPGNTVAFTPISAPAHVEGLLFYDTDDKSLAYFNENTEVKINVGQETVLRVRNTTGSTILNGQVVYVSGASGQTPTITLAQANAHSTAHTLGVATCDIADNATGYITLEGLVNDIDTSAFTDGDEVWLSDSVAGGFTATKPTASDTTHVARVGYIAYAHATQGKLVVKTSEPIDASDISGPILVADVSRDVSVGYTATSYSLGNLNSATTLSIANGNLQHGTMTGSFTLTAPNDTTEGYIDLELTMDGTGGYTLTLSGFNEVSGSFVTTASTVNYLRITKHNTNTTLEIVQAV